MDFWVGGFGRILGTNENWGKWSDLVVIMLLDIISGEIKLENILSSRVFEWLLIIVGCKIYRIKEVEASLSPRLEILGWCPEGPVLPHGEKVPL